MSWTVKQLGLALLMVVTGSINTLANSWADNTESVGSDGTTRYFDHPFFQAVCMFLGEMLCLLAFGSLTAWNKRQKKRHPSKEDEITGGPAGKTQFKPFYFLPPAICDMCASSLMNVGLVLTYPSSYQMLRGSLIIFTGLLSVAFLGRKLKAYQWTGILAVIVGLVVVGMADFLSTGTQGKDLNSVITGDLIIIIAQVIAATQMVIEERFVTKLNVAPLAAVGCEGVFGFVILGTLLIPMYYIHVPPIFSTSPEHRMEDVIDAVCQIGNSWQILVATLSSILSIAFFNFAGISVTKELSATTRTVLDSIRTLVVWAVSLGVGWEEFQYLQVVGFIILVIGMFVYNDIVITPFMRERGWLPCSSCMPPAGPQSDEAPVLHGNDRIDGAGLHNPVADFSHE